MLQQLTKYARIFVGIVFLFSALLKAIDTATFANLMSRYGAIWFGFGAPLIILVELILGILLVFDIRPHLASLATTIFLLAISAVFLYGVIIQGITDCGCFGPLTWLNSNPWLTFLRNGLLLIILVPSLIKPQSGTRLTILVTAFMAVITTIVMFMCGYTFRGADCLKKQTTFNPIPLTNSYLSEFISCSSDSTYLVFAFSYSCPYCQNSIGNVNQYQPMGFVDKVIGLAIEDSIAYYRFSRLFKTNFEIREIQTFNMYRITNTLPTTFIIRHDSIVSQYSGMVLSPALLLP